MSMMNPSNGMVAGILHQNHVAALARGPWRYIGMKPTEWENETCAETGSTVAVQKVSGTCDCCGSPICDVAVWKSVAGERMTLGLDCSITFAKHCDRRTEQKVDSSRLARNREKRAAAKARKAARNLVTHAQLLFILDELAKRPGFHGQFGRRMASDIRGGTTPTAKQIELAHKLITERIAA